MKMQWKLSALMVVLSICNGASVMAQCWQDGPGR